MAGSRGRLGELIRGFRRRAGLTQREVADLARLSVAALRDVEQGRVVRPRASTLRSLGDVLGLSRVELEQLMHESGGEAQDSGLRVEVLGPLRVFVDGTVIDPGSETQRVLLALLSLSPNTPVARDVLVESVWREQPGFGTVDSLQSRVSRLRRRLQGTGADGDGVLTAARGGYQLTVAESQHDLLVYRGLLGRARRAKENGELTEACGLYAEALGLWRGEPLEGLGAVQPHPVVVGLGHEYRAVVVEYAAVACDVGRYPDVLPLLQRVGEAEPLHEAVHAALMIALAGSGQQAAALNVFDTLRRRLSSELGADPGPELSGAYQRVLRQEVSQPERASVSAHRQLPPDIADFSGREAELNELHEMLPSADGGTAVTIGLIEGMGGVGKTKLAVRFAHQLLAEGRYADQQLYVDLRGHADQPPADPSAVLASFLRLLGVASDQIPPSLDERASLYRDRLYGKNVLVLLDNADGEDQVLPLLPASPTNFVLITSRRALALDGARSLPLDVFTQCEARELLVRVVNPARVAAEPAAVDQVVELCGGLPLAVALAGRRLQSRPAWGFAELAARLEETGDRLGELAAGSRKLHAVFDLSYAALSADERRMFRLCGLYPGDDFSVPAAAALAELPPLSVRRLLDRLVDEHLIGMVTGQAYRLHDLLVAYARDVAEKEETEQSRRAALGRLLDFYLHTAAEAARRLQPNRIEMELAGTAPAHAPALPTRQDAKQWLDAERANLIAAVTVAAEQGWPVHAWQLTRSLREYLHLYGFSHDQDWVRTHEAALAAAVAAKDARGEALTRMDLAAAYMNHGRNEDARQHLSSALEFHRSVEDHDLETSTLGSLGRLCHRLGEFGEALRYLRQAAALCAGRDSYSEGVVCSQVGLVLTALGEATDALANYQRGLVLARLSGNTAGEAAVLADIGDCYRRLGRHAEALDHVQQALKVATDNGLLPKVAYAKYRLGNVYRELGRVDEAMATMTEALRIARSAGGSVSESEVLVDLGVTYRDIGDLTTAYSLFDQGLRLAIKHGERYQEARGLNELAELHRCAARAELAQDHWRRARDLFDELGTPEAREIREFTRSIAN
ncbi:transcriptional regulator [Prauserella marina]|uniref:tetratricopeptide repeat protein n=1 Tax=Prauserella marina TaxID=530584 RepID=UPI000B8D267F|nr:tetratricopeptide repeat protein [Prauserella marina]ASR33826.1 transcriptional regulator [Prauserella marina]